MKLEYSVKRSKKRKKLTITVERDKTVIVHAPIHTSDEKIQQVVESKRSWIYGKINHPQKYQDPLHPPGKEIVSGESTLYLGRNYRIEVVEHTENGQVEFRQQFIIPCGEHATQRELLRTWYVRRAEEKIIPRTEQWAREIGVEVAQIRMVDNRYRWGSCTPKNNVHLNWRLIKAPMFVIDYIIVHELAHLLESNHTPRFWNIIRAQLTKVDEAKTWLVNNGQLLEQNI